ncbi:MAG: hypothetical protein HOP10_04145 [Chitinophagaceae bacterium]|nr:hypothetical protein [Chitinophagaceae bacterium]
MTELLHDYYKNLQCRDFDVIPSEETRQLMKSKQMMWRMAGNKLVVLIKVVNSGPDKDKPAAGIDPTDKFLFYLQLNKPQFNIVTNVDTDKLGEGKRYYFTNLHQNDIDGGMCLTKKIKAVAGPASYFPGDFTADGTGTVFECIKSTNETNNPPVAAFWHDRGKQQYVSGEDMTVPKTRIETYKVSVPAKKFDIRVYGFNILTKQYDLSIPIKNNLVTTDTNTEFVQAQLPELLPGRYKLKINTDEFDVFIDDSVVYNNVFGVMEIFAHLPGGPGFGLLDTDGTVKDKPAGGVASWLRYKIRFANRLAYWKYNTPRHGVTGITHATSLFSFDPTPAAPGDKEFFTSGKPIPLFEKPWEFKVNVQSLSNDEDPLAPNPDPNVPAMLSRTFPQKDYYCTINLNY